MRKWDLESLKATISTHGLLITDVKEIQHGQQISLVGGTKANWYSSGKVVIQGKDCDEKSLLGSVVNGGAAVSGTRGLQNQCRSV